jgi:hypothetical protein
VFLRDPDCHHRTDHKGDKAENNCGFERHGLPLSPSPWSSGADFCRNETLDREPGFLPVRELPVPRGCKHLLRGLFILRKFLFAFDECDVLNEPCGEGACGDHEGLFCNVQGLNGFALVGGLIRSGAVLRLRHGRYVESGTKELAYRLRF